MGRKHESNPDSLPDLPVAAEATTEATGDSLELQLEALRAENERLRLERDEAVRVAAVEADRSHNLARRLDNPNAEPEHKGAILSPHKSGKHAKNFEVRPIGPNSEARGLGPQIVEGCCDESEAIRVYCVSRNISPSKFRFRAVELKV